MTIPYEDILPIKNAPVTAWYVQFSDGEHRIEIWHKDAHILNVVGSLRLHHPQRKFTVRRIIVGSFRLAPDGNSYSIDGRWIDQDENVGVG